MASDAPKGESLAWQKLGDKYYTREVHYESAWDAEQVDLRKLDAFAAPFAGPVAFTAPINNKYIRLEDNARPNINVYSLSGEHLASISVVEYHSQIVTIGWNDVEHVVIILDNGGVLIYDLDGTLLRKFNLEGECKKPGILSAKVWGTGLVCLTKNFVFYALLDFDSPFTIKLKNPGLSKAPVSWAIVEPQLSAEQHLEVLIATESGSIVVTTEDHVVDMRFTHGPFVHMAVAPSGKLLAAYTESGDVWICTIDFANELSRFVTRAPKAPKSLTWCGGDAVACLWESEDDPERVLLLLGPNASFIPYRYKEPVVLVPECDGLRIITPTAIQFLHRVSTSSASVLRPAANNPAALLYRASNEFHEKHDPGADMKLRTIQRDLGKAVEVVLEAGTHEWDIKRQHALFTAAAYGQCFLSNSSSTRYIEACKLARVLTLLRTPDVGLPLSLAQFQLLTVELLTDRLLARDLHWEAHKICTFLGVSNHKVLIHWASRKVQQTRSSDREVARAIVSKLRSAPGVSFAAIAREALRHNRNELATLLLDHEPRASEQVPLLVQIGRFERALSMAVRSGDSDLTVFVLLAIKNKQPDVRLQEARRIWERVCRDTDVEELVRLYRAEGGQTQGYKLAALEMASAAKSKETEVRGEILRRVATMLKRIDEFAAAQTEEELSLFIVQRDLELSLGGTFVGSSLTSTLYRCLLLGAAKRAKELRMKFKVPNKRWWWIKIRALAQTERWDLLRSFATQPSPIGLEPFADVCLKHKNEPEAVFYLEQCPANTKKALMLVKMGRLNEALQVASAMSDPNEAMVALMRIKAKCKNAEIIAKVDGMMDSLENQGYAEAPSLAEIAADAREFLKDVNYGQLRSNVQQNVSSTLQSWWNSETVTTANTYLKGITKNIEDLKIEAPFKF